VLCAVLTATVAGYAFGRLEFPGKKILFAMVLIQMMVPAQIFIIPQYIMVSKLKWINTIAGLVFPGAVTAFGTFLLTGKGICCSRIACRKKMLSAVERLSPRSEKRSSACSLMSSSTRKVTLTVFIVSPPISL
jgi:hypothetical protein